MVAIGGELYIDSYLQLTSVAGLENLSYAGYGVHVAWSSVLASLSALDNLESIASVSGSGWGQLEINGNSSLPACWVDALEQWRQRRRRQLRLKSPAPPAANAQISRP